MIRAQNELNVMHPVAPNKTMKKHLLTVNITLLMLMLISHIKKANAADQCHFQASHYNKKWKYYKCTKICVKQAVISPLTIHLVHVACDINCTLCVNTM